MPPELLRAYIDESVALRPRGQQEYLIGAALVADDASDEVRGHLRALALPGQLKLHWKDESETRRRWIVGRIAELAPMTVVVTQMSEAARRTERCRRKCLEVLYHELVAMHVHDAVLEQRSPGVPRGGGLSGPRRRDRDGVSHRAMVSENDQELTQKDDTARWLLTSLPSSSCSGN